MAVSKADRGFDAGNALADYTSAGSVGASTLLPILESNLMISRRAWQCHCTATGLTVLAIKYTENDEMGCAGSYDTRQDW